MNLMCLKVILTYIPYVDYDAILKFTQDLFAVYLIVEFLYRFREIKTSVLH